MTYNIITKDSISHIQPRVTVIENVNYVDVREGVYLFYDEDDILLLSIKIADVYMMGNADLIQSSYELVGEKK